MSIIIHTLKNGEGQPQIVCDVCGGLIKDAKHGNVAWKEPYENIDNKKVGYPINYSIMFVCKECDRDENYPENKRPNMWYDLDTFFAFLLRNVKYDRKTAEQNAVLLSKI
jgi:hypothetical protein